MTDTAGERLRRLLSMLPMIADDNEHPVAEVAEHVGVSRETLLDDLVALTERYDISGAYDQGISIMYDEHTVTMYAPRFRRPPRITASELAALELGLALLRRERPPDEWPPIDRALGRLREVLVHLPKGDAASDAYDGVFSADVAPGARAEVLQTLRAALGARQKVALRYQGSSEATATDRVVHPYGFMFASGMWYMAAHCERADAVRVFRLDRVEAAEPQTATYTVPRSFSLNAFADRHRAFQDNATASMTVRYSPRIARWIAEREGRELDADGSLTMEHPVADHAWAVRHVLQYGAEAVVLQPHSLRRLVQRSAERSVERTVHSAQRTA